MTTAEETAISTGALERWVERLEASEALFSAEERCELQSDLRDAIDNVRLYDREHKVANTLQAATLPSDMPRVPGFLFDTAYCPGTNEAEIGGDWYDAFLLPDGRLAVSIGDVSGKGLQAAVLMSEMRHSIRANALDERCTPADILERAGRLLALTGSTLIVTAFVAYIDPVSLSFTYAGAGHPGPVLINRVGSGRVMPTDGVPLGVDFDGQPAVFTEQLHPGEMLVLYTDGLLEFDRDIFQAEHRIVQAARLVWRERPDTLAEAIRSEVMGGAEPNDDIAILCILVDDRPVQRVDIRIPASPQSASLVRRTVERFARGIGLTESEAFAVQIAVGEAVINAIEHAYRLRGGELTVQLERIDDSVRAMVQDFGAWRTASQLSANESELESERGRGLVLIHGFARDVRVHRMPGGTTVRFMIPLGGDVTEE